MSTLAKQKAYVRAISTQPALPNPSVQIAIAIDTAYVASLPAGQAFSTGIYMMDNQFTGGSSAEGKLELSTICPVGSLIGFTVYPLDPNSGDTVAITGFNVSSGNVFSSGYPQQQTPAYWVGQAINTGWQTYQIQVQVTHGLIRPTIYSIEWDPYITAQ